MNVKTRFAPSPTGTLHIGGVRTALYAYLVAKKNNGEFLLRIEDTDRARLVEGAIEDIVETIKWLGLNFVREPILQSERKELYQEQAQKLVKEGKAYLEEGAIWFKINPEGKTSIVDLVGNRTLEIPNNDQKDFVILKSDGFPTYHLAHVVDDHLMEINPVIRGPEWISSIPKHIQLFEALGWEPVRYAHIPIILGSDKSKLSKRHGAKAASEFRTDGFLPEAILNYMAFLGWTPPSGKEILSIDEMAEEFDLKDVHVSNPVFDITKLEWMNGEYIRKMSDGELLERILEYLNFISEGKLDKTKYEDKGKLAKIIPLIKERIKKLSDFVPLTDFLFEKAEYDLEIFNKLKVQSAKCKVALEKVKEKLEGMEKPWRKEVFESGFQELAKELGLSNTEMFQLIRIAISGQTVTPPLFESMEILGDEEVLKRVNEAVEFLSAEPHS